MKRSVLLLGLILVLLAGCSDDNREKPQTADAAELLDAAKAVCADRVKQQLKDPASGQVRGLTAVDQDDGSGVGATGYFKIVGEVNGKNGYGAYNGFKRFTCEALSSGTVASVSAVSATIEGN